MEIRKDDRNKAHRKVAIVTGSFMMLILGVTILGMTVFSPEQRGPNTGRLAKLNNEHPPLIGSPVAQAAEGEILPDLDEHLDSLADSLEDVIQDARGSHTKEAADEERTEEGGQRSAEQTLNDLETAAEAGTAAWNLWSLLWDVLWPKVHTFAGALWTTVLSGNK